MRDELSSQGVSDPSGTMPLSSESKTMVGAKRRGEELEEDCPGSRKQIKIRDLQSEGISTHGPENSNNNEMEDHIDIVETQSSQVLDKNAIQNADSRLSEERSMKPSTHLVDHSGSIHLDLNTELCTGENSGFDAVVSLGGPKKHSSYAKGKAVLQPNHVSLGGNRMDLNAEDVTCSLNHDPFHNHRYQNSHKMRDTSDSGRTTIRLDDKDALSKWKEMKKNGFMSSSYGYGGIPAAPKLRGRKSKNEALKQKMEQAKKEQVDRFTKIAAPSGLLNGLNPGIINHVRNSKQVHSIIQSLVRSEKRESRRQANSMRAENRFSSERNTEKENVNFSGLHGSGLSYIVSPHSLTPGSNLLCENHLSYHSSGLLCSEDRSGFRDPLVKERSFLNASLFPNSMNYSEDDILALKLASSTKASESTSCLSNEDSTNGSSVDTLSVKAATVASQWLQLLHQDIKGRLAALRRSKKRVRAVITTELPFLLSKEFPPNQENDPCVLKDPASGHSSKATADLHKLHWSKLFNQMESSLFEEEKQLKCWLNQVSEKLLHCDQGLQHVHWNTIFEMQHMGIVDNTLRSKISDPEKDLSVRAAAASIYSTCNFLSSRENVSCC